MGEVLSQVPHSQGMSTFAAERACVRGSAARDHRTEAVLHVERQHGAVLHRVPRDHADREEPHHQRCCHLHLQVGGVLSKTRSRSRLEGRELEQRLRHEFPFLNPPLGLEFCGVVPPQALHAAHGIRHVPNHATFLHHCAVWKHIVLRCLLAVLYTTC